MLLSADTLTDLRGWRHSHELARTSDLVKEVPAAPLHRSICCMWVCVNWRHDRRSTSSLSHDKTQMHYQHRCMSCSAYTGWHWRLLLHVSGYFADAFGHDLCHFNLSLPFQVHHAAPVYSRPYLCVYHLTTVICICRTQKWRQLIKFWEKKRLP